MDDCTNEFLKNYNNEYNSFPAGLRKILRWMPNQLMLRNGIKFVALKTVGKPCHWYELVNLIFRICRSVLKLDHVFIVSW